MTLREAQSAEATARSALAFCQLEVARLTRQLDEARRNENDASLAVADAEIARETAQHAG